MLRVSYLKGQIVTPKKKKRQKLTKRQEQALRARRWSYKFDMREHEKLLTEFKDTISEIKKHDPDWELPEPTF